MSMRFSSPLVLALFLVITVVKLPAQILTGSISSKQVQMSFTAARHRSGLEGSFIDLVKTFNVNPARPTVEEKVLIDLEASASYGITRFLYVKAGLGYFEHGGSVEHTDLVFPVDVTLSYLKAPMLVGLNVVKLDRFSITAESGLVLAQQIDAKEDFKNGFAPYYITYEDHKFIPFFAAGGALQVEITRQWHAQVNYRMQKALKAFYTETAGVTHREAKTYGEAVGVGVSYTLR